MNPFENQEPVKNIDKIIAVGSGKGGVGKSTVSFQLAHALGKEGLRVGLADMDIHGPSLPQLTGTTGEKAVLNENEKIEPLKKFGLHLISMGYFIDEATPAIWRGPMLFKAIEQFLKDVDWPKLDVLIVDLPPGTGDIPLTLAQKTPLFGAIVVSTPQKLSLNDARKAFEMFEQIQVPILGAIKNKDGFLNHERQILELYPDGKMDELLAQYKVDNLGTLPFMHELALASEKGLPLEGENNPFHEIGQQLISKYNLK